MTIRGLKSFFFQFIKLAIAVALLYYLFASGRVDFERLKILVTPLSLAAGVFCIGLVLYLASERWRLLLTQQGLRSSQAKAFRLSLIGIFFNFFVPGGVGGDVVKAVLIAQDHPEQRGKAVLTVLADRILGMFTMVIVALVAFGFETELLAREKSFQIIFLALFILFVGFLFAFWLLLSSRALALRGQLDRLLVKIPRLHNLWIFAQTYHLDIKNMTLLFAYSLGAQFSQILLFFAVASQTTAHPPPLSVFLFAVPVGFMVTAIPIAPAGIGIGQAAFFYLFSKAVGQETDLGVIGITAFQAFQLFYGLIGALFFVFLRRENKAPSIHDLETSSNHSTP